MNQLSGQQVLLKLRELRSQVGYSQFDRAVRSLMKERLTNLERQHRKHFSPSTYQKLFDRQKGVCSYCDEPLLIPARKNEIDHFDPNAEEFNSPRNLQLLHSQCNRKKAAQSPSEQSKQQGKTVLEMREGLDDA